MLTCSAAFARNYRCLNLLSAYQQHTRSASRLSSIKRGIRGEEADGPRRFTKGPSRLGDGRSFDEPRRSSARPDRSGREFNTDDRQFLARPARKDDDRRSDKPQRFSSDRTPRRSDDRSSEQSGLSYKPFKRNDDEPRRSFGNDDSSPRRFGKPSGNRDDKPRGTFDRSSERRDAGPRKSFEKPSRRYDDGPRKSFDRPSKDNDREPRRSFDRSSNRSSDQPQRSFDREPKKDYDEDHDRHSRSKFVSKDGDRDTGSTFSKPDTSFKKDTDYVSIPYTTAASEFLYGLNVVYAALKSRRRSLYTLYLHKRARDNVYKGADIEKLATSAGVKIRRVDNDFMPVMDKMTDNRPHNGVILEVSPLPIPSVEQLGKVEPSTKQTPLLLSRTQTAEDRAVHGITQFLPRPTELWRQPFVLMLDGILDPGNMGNILRTAYFYGVDAVAISVNTCAPLTSAALHKAASGATEALTIIAIQKPADFISTSSRNGWRIHAAVAPELGKHTRSTRAQFNTNKMVSPLSRAPSVLMMGAEGEGLRMNLKTKASHHVVIAGQQRDAAQDLGVDSLNVGAATAVLIESFLRPPVESRVAREQRAVKAAGEDGQEDAGNDLDTEVDTENVAEDGDMAENTENFEKADGGKLF